MSKAKFAAVKEFILAKQYDVARSILEGMPEDETAKKALERLNEIFPKPKTIEEMTDEELRAIIGQEQAAGELLKRSWIRRLQLPGLTEDKRTKYRVILSELISHLVSALESASAAPAAAEAKAAPTLKAGDLVEGTITSTSPTLVTVDVGAQKDGIIPVHELGRMNRPMLESLKQGATIKTYVVNPRNHNGDIVLSVNRALTEIDRQRTEEYDDFEDDWDDEEEDELEDDWDDEEEDLELQIMSLDEEHNPNELAELRARLDELKSERFHNYDAWDEDILEDMFGGDEEAYDSWLDDH